MADDALKQTIISVDYKSGEQPSATKLTRSSEQLRSAILEIDRAIGDLYSQQNHSPALSQVLTTGPGISRYLGGAGRINPRQLGRIRVTDQEVTFVGKIGGASLQPPATEGFTHYNKRQFHLPYSPILITSTEGNPSFSFTTSHASGSLSIGSPDGPFTDATVAPNQKIDPTKRVSNLDDLNASGEWHITSDGLITLYDGLAHQEGFKVTYTFDSLPHSYDGASFNVIPDFAQTSTLCTVALVSGTTYTITLPTATHMRGETLSSRTSYPRNAFWYNSSPSTSPMSGAQLELPYLISTMTVGDTIPAGYLLLWDDTAGAVVEGVTFKYASQTSVTAEGVTLSEGSTRYRIIVAGNDVTGMLDKLNQDFWRHDHSGEVRVGTGVFQGERIRHYDSLFCIDEGTDSMEGFTVSQAGVNRNPHPQYLHRYGYQYNESISDPGNVDNAFLGNLVISDTNQEIGDGSVDSYFIAFGGQTSGFPRIKYVTDTDDVLDLSEANVRVQEKLKASDGIVSGANDFADGSLKWIPFSGDMSGSSPSTISFMTPSDFNVAYGIQLACSVSTGFWHFDQDEDGATYELHVSYIEIGGLGNTIVTISHGSEMNSKTVYGVLFYM